MKINLVNCIIIVVFLFSFIKCTSDDMGSPDGINNKIKLTNTTVDSVNYRTAIMRTKIIDIHENEITQYGHCWSINQNPTILDNYSEYDTLKFDTITSKLFNLDVNTDYYARAYIKLQDVFHYSDSIISFKTKETSIPTITTKKFNQVTENSAQSGGVIEDDNGSEVVTMGICWNNSGTPTINDNSTNDGNGNEEYVSLMQGLSQSETYYVRAYAINEKGIAYGNELTLNLVYGEDLQVEDYDGNWYNTVVIGDQIWLKENLKTTHYPNGTPIRNGAGLDIDNETSPKYYFVYDDDETNVETYGRLYTWYAATDACPDGWHMPTEEDWSILKDYVGYENGGKLKSTGTIEAGTGLWNEPNTEATNTYGFDIVPSGSGSSFNSIYKYIGEMALYIYADDNVYGITFRYNSGGIGGLSDGSNGKSGYSVRCIKNE